MNNISSCDENRLRIAKEAEESFDLARRLVANGKYEEALKPYLFAFDNGRYVNGWGGVRLSYIPSEIAQLGAKYAPALDALRERRDAREEMIRQGQTDFDVVAEWTSLNRYLGEKSRMLAMLDSLGKDLRIKIIRENVDELLASKEYKLAGEVLNDEGRSFFMWEHGYETEKHFPRALKNSRWTSEEKLEYERQIVRQHGLKVFELALAVKKTAPAKEVARRLLIHCGEADTFAALIKIASDLKCKMVSKQLLKDAKARLSTEDFARVQKLIH